MPACFGYVCTPLGIHADVQHNAARPGSPSTQGWLSSVKTLAEHYDPSSHHAEDNEAIPPVLLATMDDEELLGTNGGSSALQQSLVDTQDDISGGDMEKQAVTVP